MLTGSGLQAWSGEGCLTLPVAHATSVRELQILVDKNNLEGFLERGHAGRVLNKLSSTHNA